MLILIFGIIGFALYFLYDINSFTKQTKVLSSAFMAGTVLLAVSTVMMLVQAWQAKAFSGFYDILLLISGLLMFMALIYCLFFALPFNETMPLRCCFACMVVSPVTIQNTGTSVDFFAV